MHQKMAKYAEILKISTKINKSMQNPRKYAINWCKLTEINANTGSQTMTRVLTHAIWKNS